MAGREDVEAIQEWLNRSYGSHSEWVDLDEDGIAGWGTIRGLIRGLQIELGFTGNEVDGVFGNALKAAVPVLTPPTSTPQRIICIAQSALRVKGYNAATVDSGEFGHFIDNTVLAVQKLSDDANYRENRANNGNPTIDKEVWKGLCSQDAYVLVQGGDPKLRTIQQRLNDSVNQPAMGLNPTDGIVTPQLARGLIKAVQVLLGFTNTDDPSVPGAADGIWGSGTAKAVRDIRSITAGAGQRWWRLLAYALYVNGYDSIDVDDPAWGDVAGSANDFGYSLRLNVTPGQTQAVSSLIVSALFVSYGDQNRGWNDLRHDVIEPMVGIDTATRLTGLTKTFVNPDADLYKLHVGFVGRYMQNAPNPVLDKEMTLEEIEELSQLRTENEFNEVAFGIAPIWQTSANSADYFIPGRGTTDAESAHARADSLGIPNNVTIYFAVDFDAFGSVIDDPIVPYFVELNTRNAQLGGRPIGVYGPRAVCNRMNAEGLATASYVGNLSYGWTGNLGQPMPSNWAIDQFVEFNTRFCDDDGNEAGTFGVDQLIHNPGNGQLWYPEAD